MKSTVAMMPTAVSCATRSNCAVTGINPDIASNATATTVSSTEIWNGKAWRQATVTWPGGPRCLAQPGSTTTPGRALEVRVTTGDFDVPPAVEAAEAITERAQAAGDQSGAMLARAMALQGRNYLGEPDATDEVIALCRAALPLEEERGDPRRLALLWEMLASAAEFHQQHDDTVEALVQALSYQRPRRLLTVETYSSGH